MPRHPDLLRELAGLTFGQSERGIVKIEAGSGAAHDDVADALMLAAAPYSHKGHVKCRLARFAAMSLPDAEVPEVEDVVHTGSGLTVPRRPFLQSVNGPEVSLPPELTAPARPASSTQSSGLELTCKQPGADAPMDDDDRYRPERAEEEDKHAFTSDLLAHMDARRQADQARTERLIETLTRGIEAQHDDNPDDLQEAA